MSARFVNTISITPMRCLIVEKARYACSTIIKQAVSLPVADQVPIRRRDTNLHFIHADTVFRRHLFRENVGRNIDVGGLPSSSVFRPNICVYSSC